jgi:hypothetical protein
MKSDEVERLVREFIKANPQYTKNSFSIDLEESVQVIPGIARLEDLKEMSKVTFAFSSMITYLKKCTSQCSITISVK